ncbi:MAG: FAD-binding oxidoreductase [Cyanothece sp. SIO2G6]|nr:FAD-binding oxidoreductase [Cyanothece sp. SIO2G6]
MERVVIVGCGVVGAAIAYELSAIAHWEITVLDHQPPAQGSTGAALGVLMGAISQKRKGRGWRLRQLSLQRYETWVPELERLTGQAIPFNRDGLVLLTFDDEDMDKWYTLQTVRQDQGWPLEIWDRTILGQRCPLVGDRFFQEDTTHTITGAIYSPQDRQIDPTALTHALVAASKNRGVRFHLDAAVTGFEPITTSNSSHPTYHVHTRNQSFTADWLILSAGIGTTSLTQASSTPLDIRPVLGQAMRVRIPEASAPFPSNFPSNFPPDNKSDHKIAASFQPVITSHDIHIVPLGDRDYWVGATVEFPDETGQVEADAALLDTVWEGAITLYPPLAQGTVIEQWSGRRPRPFGRPAPIVEFLEGYERVILAAGHYRNGVLLAPATAQLVRELMVDQTSGVSGPSSS